jgi:DNA-binding IclR family transcriptional regulator
MSETINAIERALKIIETLRVSKNELGVSEISAKLDEYKSTVYRTLLTLKSHGYVYQNPENEKFGLGIQLYAIGVAAEERVSRNIAVFLDPIVAELMDNFREVVTYQTLNISSFSQQILLYKKTPPSVRLQFIPEVGSVTEAHCSAAGKSMLAHSGPAYLESIQSSTFNKYTANTIGDWETLKKELELIRTRGYALDNEETELGLSCVGVFVGRDHDRLYALSLSGPTTRMNSYNEAEVASELQKAAKRISQRLLLSS